MIQKAISLTTGFAILSVYLWSLLQPSDALFLFSATNLLVNVALLSLAALMVRVSFMNEFKTALGYTLTVGGAGMCLLVGIGGILSTALDYKFYSLFGPLDFLLLTEAGIVFTICALSYKHQPSQLKFSSLRLPRLTFVRPSPGMPKILFDSLKHAHLF